VLCDADREEEKLLESEPLCDVLRELLTLEDNDDDALAVRLALFEVDKLTLPLVLCDAELEEERLLDSEPLCDAEWEDERLLESEPLCDVVRDSLVLKEGDVDLLPLRLTLFDPEFRDDVLALADAESDMERVLDAEVLVDALREDDKLALIELLRDDD
jgi:hypothetical protein